MVWALWHIPYWLTLDSFDEHGAVYLLMNVLSVAPVSIYITWFFVHTSGSLLLPVAFHMTFNLVNVSLFQVTSQLTPYWVLIAIQWAIAGIVVLRGGTGLSAEGSQQTEAVRATR